ncbi:MAG: copper oxidase, partial [Alphaproteobacteria bacterium]
MYNAVRRRSLIALLAGAPFATLAAKAAADKAPRHAGNEGHGATGRDPVGRMITVGEVDHAANGFD